MMAGSFPISGRFLTEVGWCISIFLTLFDGDGEVVLNFRTLSDIGGTEVLNLLTLADRSWLVILSDLSDRRGALIACLEYLNN